MLAHIAAGMLSVPLNGDKGFLVWFRPEFRNTVTYAGKPPDESETVEMGPRASFAAFDQINKLRCRAWTDEDKTAALALAELVSHVCTVENDATEATLVALNQERMKALIIPKSFLCSDFV
jgi:light-regulated signal transduction histidine kinase (bacteriophytochrome)